ncbi:hypothetical protein C8J57DRAFT_1345728, partial [Mycena rebaudengoi]
MLPLLLPCPVNRIRCFRFPGNLLPPAGIDLVFADVEIRVGDTEDWTSLELSTADKVQLYDALQQLHAAGVIHGDFYPRNIMRRADSTFCIIDFGDAEIDYSCPGSTCWELDHLRLESDI